MTAGKAQILKKQHQKKEKLKTLRKMNFKNEGNSNCNSNCLLEATLVVPQTHDRALLG